MYPKLILFLCIGFIVWLFRTDIRFRDYASSALWIPGLWLAQIASRNISFWLSFILGINLGGSSDVEGNPVNLAALLILMVAAAVVLHRRGFLGGNLSEETRFSYCCIYIMCSASFGPLSHWPHSNECSRILAACSWLWWC